MRTITPVYLRFYPREPTVLHSYSIMDFWNEAILSCSALTFFHAKLTILPPFTPNEYMLKSQAHRSPDNQPWEIYAECVRDAMAEHGKFTIDNTSYRDMINYHNLYNAYEETVTIDGKTFSYVQSKGDKNSQLGIEKSKSEAISDPLLSKNDLETAEKE